MPTIRYSCEVSLLEHKKARFDYEILEEYEAGLELLGSEVKALRGKHGKIEGAHAIIRGGEAYLVGMSIPPYQPGNTAKEYDPTRTRKLLLTKKELKIVAGFEGQKGLTIVPLRVYNKGKHLKVLLGVARGRKRYDKRAVLKERDTKREMQRTLKNK
ncbi:SsrA-binding protein [Candidatus Adlerbacteria bacterium RIFCSPHIGHO2_02_FULL_54_18]|uniref:SsrA-binding protein n=2 Tax=Candidatus Adleribacteriota TaxID=1752736 RepID=A0A1F4Y4V8_9BACT|nr:MAG: SsrA-binding protein [Candidatus Adlerbacteria bacterium RIFCSPLOWO2_01_FULL_54_21b]OGC88908.1 MAG: SsrA-binding protein [Candidatus Adlerbacteria bacterium RIFCSPHIGHO2_02_FULL_54_18]